MTRTLALALALLAAAAACTFSYKNPAEDLRPGEVGGRAVVAAAPRAGVAVSVKGSSLAQGTRATGRFLLLPLPAGNHTLLLRNGAGGLTARDVEIRYGRDGQPEGVWLGDVSVPASTATARVSGAVAGTLPSYANLYVHDALTGATSWFQNSGASFTLDALSVGEHVLTFVGCDLNYGACQIGGPVTVRITDADAGFEKLLATVPLHAPAPPDRTGRLKVRLAAIGAVDLASYAFTGLPAGATPDSTGLVDVTAPEGLYTVGVSGGTGTDELPPQVSTAVIEGRVTDLGTLYVTSSNAIAQTAGACASDADCAPGVCVNHACSDAFVPPVVAPAGVPLCDTQNRSCAIGQPCSPQYASYTAVCVDAGAGVGVCIPQGACCTVDGLTSLCAPPP